MQTKRIFILGGSGFIGSALLEKLIKLNFKLYVYVRKNNANKLKSHKIKYVNGDISSSVFWKKNIKNK